MRAPHSHYFEDSRKLRRKMCPGPKDLACAPLSLPIRISNLVIAYSLEMMLLLASIKKRKQACLIGHGRANSQSLESGGPYGPYSIFSPRYGPYSKVGTYSIEDNIDLILAWVHTNRPPIRKTFENRTVDPRCLCLRLFLAVFL